jgi:hypothetical protein
MLIEGSNIWIDKCKYEQQQKYVCVWNFKDFPCYWFENNT